MATTELEGLSKGDVLIATISGRLLKMVFVKYGKGRIRAVPITRVKYEKKTWRGWSGNTSSYWSKCHEVELNSDVIEKYNHYVAPTKDAVKAREWGTRVLKPHQAVTVLCHSVKNSIGYVLELDVSCLSSDEKKVYDDIMKLI